MAEIKKKPVIILTGGDGGYGNLGDEWLLAAVKSRYSEIKKSHRVAILMANIPEDNSDGFEYVEDNQEAFSKKKIPVNDIKAVHYYGGGYLNSYWIKDKLWLYDHLVGCGLEGNKFFFTSQGLGPFSALEMNKVNLIGSSSSFFGTRDKIFLEKVTNSQFMFDETIHLIKYRRRMFRRRKELWINFRTAEHVGADNNNILKFVGETERFAKIYGLKVKYFAMIKGKCFNEKLEMEYVLRKAGISSDVVERADNYRELMERFKNAAMVVTTSYHATLASLYMNIPVISVYENEYYDLKFRGLKEVVDSPLLNLLTLDDYQVSIYLDSLKRRDKGLNNRLFALKAVNENAYRSLMDRFKN